MKRLAILVLPLLVLAACETGVPTAAETDGLTTPTLAVTLALDEGTTNVNLYTASTVQVVIPSVSTVPTTATLTNNDNGDSGEPIHTFDAGCTTHFQDVDGDGSTDLILHFDVDDLFGTYDTAALPTEAITLTLAVTWEDADGIVVDSYDAEYAVQLVYTVPNGYRGGR